MRQRDLEGVMAMALRAFQQTLGRRHEGLVCRRPPMQQRLGFRHPPGLVRHASERDARLRYPAFRDLQAHRDRDQRKGKGVPVPQLQVAVMRPKRGRRQDDSRDDLVLAELSIALRLVARQPVEIRDGNAALPATTRDLHHRLERGQRHAHVGGVRRDAMLACAQDGVLPVHAANGGAATAGDALVAGRRRVIKVVAAGPLQQIAAGCRQVAELRRRAREDRARKQRPAGQHARIRRHPAVGRQRAEQQAAIRQLLDRVQPRQAVEVDQPYRPLDVVFHQIDEIGAAGDQPHRRIGSPFAQRLFKPCRAYIRKAHHGAAPAACSIASTMLG
jgi:hypothetical protein